jgi:hypothetical protein
MSIATLKKKTQTKYNNMSVGMHHFSLNGTLRNQGYVGQTSLSRSLPRTKTPGCTQFVAVSLNDPDIIKPSVTGTLGMLEKKYMCCHQIVKPDSNQHINVQSTYVNHLARQTIHNYNICDATNDVVLNNKCYQSYNAYYRKNIPVVSSIQKNKIITSDEYIREMNKECTNHDITYVPNNNFNYSNSCRE